MASKLTRVMPKTSGRMQENKIIWRPQQLFVSVLLIEVPVLSGVVMKRVRKYRVASSLTSSENTAPI